MRSVMPAVFMRLPARMKNGTASNGNESTPLIMRWITTSSGTLPSRNRKMMDEPASAMATGNPTAIMPNNATKRTAISIGDA